MRLMYFVLINITRVSFVAFIDLLYQANAKNVKNSKKLCFDLFKDAVKATS